MEEILASIRRIIAEDGEEKPADAAPPAAEEEVLELTEVVQEEEPPPAPDRSAFEVSRLLMTRPECGMCETTDQTCRSLSG